MYNSGFCRQWKVLINDCSTANDCIRFVHSKTANKGMQIRKNKLDKQMKKRVSITAEQENLVCFVEYSERIIERINGKYRRPVKIERGKGLQIKNKIYLPDGRYKFVNRSTLTITDRLIDVPTWANEYLRSLYFQICDSKPVDTQIK